MNRNFERKILSIIFALLTLLCSVNLLNNGKAFAETIYPFDQISVMQDLESVKDFSFYDYPAKAGNKKELEILNFVEFGYSRYSKNLFALYLYVYNPYKLDIKEQSVHNTVSLAVEFDEFGTPTRYGKFSLIFCSKSDGEFEGLYYKFRIQDEYGSDGKRIIDRLSPEKRLYFVSGFELLLKGDLNATDFKVGCRYEFEGYAKGFGKDKNAESTLKCTAVKDMETVSLDVKSTFYRPEGNNGKDSYTQDSLHSVYFAVPNELIEKYGELYAVHASWLNAVLKPALVVGNKEVYDAIKPFLGIDIDSLEMFNENKTPNYALFGALRKIPERSHIDFYNYGYNSRWIPDCASVSDGDLNSLYLIFPTATFGVDIADSYVVSSEIIMKEMEKSLSSYGGQAVLEKYSSNIFESVDENFIEITYSKTDTFSLADSVLSQNFFERLFGIKNYSTSFESVKAIEPVSVADLKLSEKDFCSKYFVSTSDFQKIIDYATKNENSTTYLFRYMVSDYVSQECTVYERGFNFLGQRIWSLVDTNAYFFQQTMNLNFDIIDLTFEKDGKYKVIPAVSNPVDIVHDGTPPIETKSDRSILDIIFAWLLFIGSIVLCAVILGMFIKAYLSISKIDFLFLRILCLILCTAVLGAVVYLSVTYATPWIIEKITALGGL